MEIKKIKVSDLNLPPAPAQAPQIDWGQEFLDWDVKQQNRYLKRLCSALNHATDNIQKERNEVLETCHEIAKVAEQADKAVEIQKGIVNRAITSYNAEKQDLIKRLQELEQEVKEKNKYIEELEFERDLK